MFCLRFFEMYENKQMKRDALNRPTGPHTPSRNHLKSSMHPTFQGLPKPFLGCVDGHGCEQSFSSFSQKIIISNYLGPIFRWVRETWKFYEVFPGKQESGFPPAGRGSSCWRVPGKWTSEMNQRTLACIAVSPWEKRWIVDFIGNNFVAVCAELFWCLWLGTTRRGGRLKPSLW